MEKTNTCLKNNELTAVLDTHFKGKINLAITQVYLKELDSSVLDEASALLI